MILLLTFAVLSPLHAQEVAEAQAYRTVNVRSGPGTQYPVIARLENGDTAKVLGRNDEESNWLFIEHEGLEGWIAYFTVHVTGDLSQLPIIEDIAPSTTLPSQSTANETRESAETPQVTAFRAVNVRSAPGVGNDRLGVLRPGESAPITGKTADAEWLRIDFNGQEAWIAFFVVNVSGDIESLPVIASPQALQAQAAPTALEVTARFNANLRATPHRNAELMTVIPYGTQLRVTARNASSDWLRVEYNGMVGWLVTSLVSIAPNDDLNQLPIETS